MFVIFGIYFSSWPQGTKSACGRDPIVRWPLALGPLQDLLEVAPGCPCLKLRVISSITPIHQTLGQVGWGGGADRQGMGV
jgi:hypothetical protein